MGAPVFGWDDTNCCLGGRDLVQILVQQLVRFYKLLRFWLSDWPRLIRGVWWCPEAPTHASERYCTVDTAAVSTLIR